MTAKRRASRTNAGQRVGMQHKRSPATKAFLAGLGLVAVAYLALITYSTSVPRGSTPVDATSGYLEQCRELCLQYGLIPTGDIAADAKAYLVAARTSSVPSSASDESPAVPQPSLVGASAPDFELADTEGRKVALRDLRREGPVLVVFYYGYFCSHCVAQLFGLEQDLSKFERSGVRIVALSPDPPNETAAKFHQYGRFHFPVLSDPENRVAELYSVYSRATQNREEDHKHGTFLVDQNGTIRWAYTGYRPYVDTDSLLRLASGHAKSMRADKPPSGATVPMPPAQLVRAINKQAG